MGRAGGREGRKGVERSAAQGLEAPPRLSMRAAGPVERLRDGQRDRRLEPPAHNRRRRRVRRVRRRPRRRVWLPIFRARTFFIFTIYSLTKDASGSGTCQSLTSLVSGAYEKMVLQTCTLAKVQFYTRISR